jgi:hypothetical protein
MFAEHRGFATPCAACSHLLFNLVIALMPCLTALAELCAADGAINDINATIFCVQRKHIYAAMLLQTKKEKALLKGEKRTHHSLSLLTVPGRYHLAVLKAVARSLIRLPRCCDSAWHFALPVTLFTTLSLGADAATLAIPLLHYLPRASALHRRWRQRTLPAGHLLLLSPYLAHFTPSPQATLALRAARCRYTHTRIPASNFILPAGHTSLCARTLLPPSHFFTSHATLHPASLPPSSRAPMLPSLPQNENRRPSQRALWRARGTMASGTALATLRALAFCLAAPRVRYYARFTSLLTGVRSWFNIFCVTGCFLRQDSGSGWRLRVCWFW